MKLFILLQLVFLQGLIIGIGHGLPEAVTAAPFALAVVLWLYGEHDRDWFFFRFKTTSEALKTTRHKLDVKDVQLHASERENTILRDQVRRVVEPVIKSRKRVTR